MIGELMRAREPHREPDDLFAIPTGNASFLSGDGECLACFCHDINFSPCLSLSLKIGPTSLSERNEADDKRLLRSRPGRKLDFSCLRAMYGGSLMRARLRSPGTIRVFAIAQRLNNKNVRERIPRANNREPRPARSEVERETFFGARRESTRALESAATALS